MLLSVGGVTGIKLGRYSRFKFGLALGIGALVAAVLCVQCVRAYLYTDAVLVPRQAEREAERLVGALTTAARSAGIADPHALGPVIEHALESAGDRVLSMRVLDPESDLLAQAGNPRGTAKIPSRWWESVEAHKPLGVLVDTSEGKAFVAMLPSRLPGPPPGRRPGAYVIELAIPLKAVAGAFDGLRQNLIVGVIASIALLLSLAGMGLRTPRYLRGRYLESELQLARRVQSDLQPKPSRYRRTLNSGHPPRPPITSREISTTPSRPDPARLPSCWAMFRARKCLRRRW